MELTTWNQFLEAEAQQDYFKRLNAFLKEEAKNYTIYPKQADIFSAFKYTPLNKVRSVILGMDPYINEGQAHGLAFSVPKGIEPPPSLQNIFRELNEDIGVAIPEHGCLLNLAKQGVMLLNTILTVRAGQSGSHRGIGWEKLTDHAIELINQQDRPIVFLLWGADARKKRTLLTNPKHFVIESSHPSPLSAYRGFFGSKPFSKTNQFLSANNAAPIDWAVL
jgi:uracil-DNA glycosylase